MAKKKKTVTRRRRSVGAVSGQASLLAGVAVGALAARFISSRFLATFDPKINAAVQAAAGLFLTTQRNPMLKAAGLGIFGSGVIAAGQSFNLISGVPSRSSYLQPVSMDEMPVIAGYQNSFNYLGNPQGDPQMNVVAGLGNPQNSPDMNVISGIENLCS